MDLDLSDETGIAGTTWGELKHSAMLVEYKHPPVWFVSLQVFNHLDFDLEKIDRLREKPFRKTDQGTNITRISL